MSRRPPAACGTLPSAGTVRGRDLKLTLGTGQEIENPSQAQLEAALHGLPGGADSFAILSHQAQTYMQTSGGPTEGFVLEYRDGSDERHFRCTDHALPLAAVLAAFSEYLASSSEYRERLAWELDEPSREEPTRVGYFLLAAVVLVGFLFYRWFS